MIKIYRRMIFILIMLSIVSIVLAAPAGNTAPVISNIDVVSIADTGARITFTVDQFRARTVIDYGETESLGTLSSWDNGTRKDKGITLYNLLSGKKYYYSIHAYNNNNQSLSSSSQTQSFTTTNTTITDPITPNDTAPDISNINVDDTTSSTANISFRVSQNDADTRIYYGTSEALGTWSNWNNDISSQRRITLSGLSNDTRYNFSIYAYNGSNNSYYKNSTIGAFTTKNVSSNGTDNNTGNNTGNAPSITSTTPEKTVYTEGNQSVNFTILFDQVVDIKWYLNGANVKTNDSATSSYYLNTTPSVGTWNITATGKNGSKTTSYSWTWTVRPETSNTGNRIWDGTKGMSTTYIWNSFSFSGFYYDLDNNISTEQLTIRDIKSTIDQGDVIYTTSPIDVDFEYSNFGEYQVIGFMASKYFAGYTENSSISNKEKKSTIGNGQLQKILLDDDEKRTLTQGGTLTLEEGYVLQMKEVDVGAGKGQIWLVLLKDGSEVDNGVIAGGDTYIYSKKVGGVDELPIIAVHFDTVFRGKETNAAFVKGIFQISESVTSIKSGDRYSKMEISGIGSDKITMDNRDSIGLSRGNTIDLMGDLKIIVADSNTLRFALSIDRPKGTGEVGEIFEVRGTIYPVTNKWTPMNFGLNVGNKNLGFYYDLDEDIGTESLKMENISGSTIPDGKLIYSTSPQEVSFGYSNFGKYQVIGFMADKYFAGYTENTKPPNPSTTIEKKSVVSQGELHKVLIDDDKQRTVSVGSTLTLKDGYVLKAKDIDSGARTMLLSLLKDGSEVDETPLSAGQTYVYTKKMGSAGDVPLIITRFDSVFSGKETQAAFVKGMFQISENYTSVKSGDTYEKMEVSSANANGISMINDGSISLSAGNVIDLMGDIKLKVADSSDVRFYPFVEISVDMVEISSNQLIIDVPLKITAGDTINMEITAGGSTIDGASVTVNNVEIGKTNITGDINYTIPKTYKGAYYINVTKTGYQTATKKIEIQEYIEGKLSIGAPVTANQFDTISIYVTSNGTAVSGVMVIYDNVTIGTTGDYGVVNYTLESSGIHTISTIKSGYISISREIDVKAPFSEFNAQGISIIPNKISRNDKVLIRSNITNVGTKADTKSIELLINGSAVDNISLSLNPKEIKEINFTYKASLPQGNYTVEIIDKKGTLEVKDAPFNILLIAAILTVIGAIIVYIITTKDDRIVGLIKKYKK